MRRLFRVCRPVVPCARHRGPFAPASGRSCATAVEETVDENDVEPGKISAAYGSRFLRRATHYVEAKEEIRSATIDAKVTTIAAETVDPVAQTRLQLKTLFKDLPGHASQSYAYLLHCQDRLNPKLNLKQKPEFRLKEEEFIELYTEERQQFLIDRRNTVRRRRQKIRNFFMLNAGYKEEDDVYEAEEDEFTAEWRLKSIVEDCWKAEYHSHLHRLSKQMIPERQPLATRTDRVADVLGAALRSHVNDQNRPVLTHELSDFENPYMTKRSTMERLLQERCVRNKLDERVMPRVLDAHPALVKLRAEAALPPEVLEPLAAFRGDTRWHFDARERLAQKLEAVDTALDAVVASKGSAAKVAAATPENAETKADQVPGVNHPWRNHVGFESDVPRGVAGGSRMGQPMKAIDAQLLKLRYPTLQRVAHTLPADPKWRAHVTRSIRVLERSKQWDFASKLRAINSMKEIYDNLRPSEYYTAALDEKLPVNRVPSHLKKKYARDAQYVKTFPRKFMKKKTHEWYRASLTAKNSKKSKVS